MDFAELKLAEILILDYHYYVPTKEIEGYWMDYKDDETITIKKSEYLYLHEQSEYLFDLIHTNKLRDYILENGGKTYNEINEK